MTRNVADALRNWARLEIRAEWQARFVADLLAAAAQLDALALVEPTP